MPCLADQLSPADLGGSSGPGILPARVWPIYSVEKLEKRTVGLGEVKMRRGERDHGVRVEWSHRCAGYAEDVVEDCFSGGNEFATVGRTAVVCFVVQSVRVLFLISGVVDFSKEELKENDWQPSDQQQRWCRGLQKRCRG